MEARQGCIVSEVARTVIGGGGSGSGGGESGVGGLFETELRAVCHAREEEPA